MYPPGQWIGDERGAGKRMKGHGLALMTALATVPVTASGQSKPATAVEAQSGSDALPPEGVRTIQDAIKALNTRANDKSVPAQPLGNPGDFFGPDAYPASAVRAQEQGRALVRIEIDAGGFPTACSVLSSSGSTALDVATCRIAQTRMQYSPARDARGRAVASHYTFPVRWSLPNGPVPVDPAMLEELIEQTVSFDAKGDVTACTFTITPVRVPKVDPCAEFPVGKKTGLQFTHNGKPVGGISKRETRLRIIPDAPSTSAP